MTSTIAPTDQGEIRKRDYKHLLSKYKNSEEANAFFKLQLQDLNARLKLENKEKERLHQELQKARSEILKKPLNHQGGSLHDADLEEVNARLKEAYQKLEEEFDLREQLNKELEYAKAMLLAEEKTRLLLENRNTVLEQDSKNTGFIKTDSDLRAQLEEAKKRLEGEVKSRLALQEAKESLEAELEDLTKSLFEEANTMVSKEAREKFELQQAKKRLEQELELAKSKIMLDEKLLVSMRHKFTALEMKAKKLHRRTGSSNNVIPSSSSSTNPQLRPTSSHPNLLTLKDEVELMQRSKSYLHLGGSLPSSPVSQLMHASPITSPIPPNANPSRPFVGIPLSPEHVPSIDPHPNVSHIPITPTTSPRSSPTKPIPIALESAIASNPISIPSSKPKETNSINPASTSPVAHDYTLTTGTTVSSDGDDTYSETSMVDTASVVEDWDVDWLLEDAGEEKEDDNTLYVEMEGKIDSQGGLSNFVHFISAPKQDWTARFMDKVLRDDVGPCLRLRGTEDRAYRKLLEAVWNNKIFMEPLVTPLKEVCSGCGAESTCKWRIKMGSSSQECKNMGDMCRERIVRTCDFYLYLRNLRQGLVKKTLPTIFKEYLRLRLRMNFARISAG